MAYLVACMWFLFWAAYRLRIQAISKNIRYLNSGVLNNVVPGIPVVSPISPKPSGTSPKSQEPSKP